MLRRAARYGLYAAVLAGLVGGVVAWAGVDKTIHLQVDGTAQTVRTTSTTVGGALKDAGYGVGIHDLVAPAAGAHIGDGQQIVLRRGRLLHLTVDGHVRDIWTVESSVDAALADLGYTTTDFASVSRDSRLPLGSTAIVLRTPKVVSVVHDHRTDTVSTTDATVGDLMHDLEIPVGPGDRLTPPATAALTDHLRVTLGRVTTKVVTARLPAAYPTTRANDPALPTGTTQIVTLGRDGVVQIAYKIVYVDGVAVGRTEISRTTVTAPTAQVEHVGTAPPAATSTGAAAGGTASAPTVTVTPGSAQALAESMLPAFGWSDDQMSCLITMWDHESGWRVNASNGGSGAYGIPQALPGSKMAVYGADWQTNPRTQITWGLHYIASRYGTPCGAWAQWQANGGWY